MSGYAKPQAACLDCCCPAPNLVSNMRHRTPAVHHFEYCGLQACLHLMLWVLNLLNCIACLVCLVVQCRAHYFMLLSFFNLSCKVCNCCVWDISEEHACCHCSTCYNAFHILAARDKRWFTGAGLLAGEGTRPGQLALAVYCQLEADVDDTLAAQAVKCLVHLSKEMLEADRAEGLRKSVLHEGLDPAARPEGKAADDGHNAVAASTHEQDGAHAADSEAESDHEEEQGRPELGQDGAPGLTLPGLVRRMAKMAGDR